MGWISRLTRFLKSNQTASSHPCRRVVLQLETLEEREVPAAVSFSSGVLTITGTASEDRILVKTDTDPNYILAQDNGRTIGRYHSSLVTQINIYTLDGNDRIQVDSKVKQSALLDGGNGKNLIIAGGGPTTLVGGDGDSKLAGGSGSNTYIGGSGNELIIGGTGTNTGSAGAGDNKIIQVDATDSIFANTGDKVLLNRPNPQTISGQSQMTITAEEVQQILLRATAASASTDAIIAVVDRNGRILGVRVENGVASEIVNDTSLLTFAVDGAVSLARTAAMFSSNGAPLTSRTIGFISQSTITQREVESNPNITNENSTERGPGFVAAVGTGGHFPPGIANTPEVDLFAIEHTNRDSLIHSGVDAVKGTADDITLAYRFNIDAAYVQTAKEIFAPESYGYESGLLKSAQSRGIGTLPGGIPLYKNGELVGGIGVFFPGKTGYATEMNSSLSATYDPTKADRSLEAEYIAFAAAGGAKAVSTAVGTLDGIQLPAGFNLPFGRIDLVGVTLDIYGPGGSEGVKTLFNYGKTLGVGKSSDGRFLTINAGADNTPKTGDDIYIRNGLPVADGWLVTAHDGVGITAAQVSQVINNGIRQAWQTRSQLRLPANSSTRMVFAVTDLTGAVVGLYRMPDAPTFSIDVAVAKARNVTYYADTSDLQAIDQLSGIASGVAFTNRTFRYLALPRFPSTVDGSPPAPFSILNDGGSDLTTGKQVGAKLAASAFKSVLGYDAFHPNTNFHDKTYVANQNGVVFFPGSAPLYQKVGSSTKLIGGFGVSGDGVDQDDVVTTYGQVGYEPSNGVMRADQVFYRGVRLPYQKYNRNATGGVSG